MLLRTRLCRPPLCCPPPKTILAAPFTSSGLGSPPSWRPFPPGGAELLPEPFPPFPARLCRLGPHQGLLMGSQNPARGFRGSPAPPRPGSGDFGAGGTADPARHIRGSAAAPVVFTWRVCFRRDN